MLAVVAWFLLVYVGCNWITLHHTRRVPVHFTWEVTRMPFVPAMTVIYSSLYAPIFLSPFVLRRRGELLAGAAAQAVNIAVGGICFLLFPSSLAYRPTPDPGLWRPLFDLADTANLEHNLAPSLHVALGIAVALSLARRAPRGVKILLAIWAALLAVSTMLTWQHHLVDVISGLALALVTHTFVERPLQRRLASRE
jgi:membrane-associated phospholipid phosphatase